MQRHHYQAKKVRLEARIALAESQIQELLRHVDDSPSGKRVRTMAVRRLSRHKKQLAALVERYGEARTSNQAGAAQSAPTPSRAARRLNSHHVRVGAGFYGARGLSGRFFRARVRCGVLQVTPDFGESWQDVDLAQHAFCDHNGRAIAL
jgi:uncharacterized coiled-coil protein SlyX